MSKAKNKALKIGGIALIIWLLLRKAGSSAPIPGDTYGAPGDEKQTNYPFGGNVKTGKRVIMDGTPGEMVNIAVWSKPYGNFTQKYFIKDAKTNTLIFATAGRVIGTVAAQTAPDSNGIVWIKLKPVWPTPKPQWVPIGTASREPNGYWVQ